MIRSFRCAETQAFFEGHRSKRFDSIRVVLERKLRMLHVARRLDDLKVPPGDRLEELKGNRKGQHSIRINQQLRLCFVWTAAGPENVEAVDYH